MYKPIFPNLKYLDVSIFHYELALGLRLSCLAYLCMLRPKTTLSWDYFLTGIIFKKLQYERTSRSYQLQLLHFYDCYYLVTVAKQLFCLFNVTSLVPK